MSSERTWKSQRELSGFRAVRSMGVSSDVGGYKVHGDGVVLVVLIVFFSVCGGPAHGWSCGRELSLPWVGDGGAG